MDGADIFSPHRRRRPTRRTAEQPSPFVAEGRRLRGNRAEKFPIGCVNREGELRATLEASPLPFA